ncbi:hypothetical protein GIHI108528_14285 [Gillisia hiemivivida]
MDVMGVSVEVISEFGVGSVFKLYFNERKHLCNRR